MSENRDFFRENQLRFSEITAKILRREGFAPVSVPQTGTEAYIPALVLRKGEYTYCVEIRCSRSLQFNSRSAVSAAARLLEYAKEKDWLPMIVVGGKISASLRGELVGLSVRTIVLDMENLLYMTQQDRELRAELVALLPFSTETLIPRKPELLPIPDGNGAYEQEFSKTGKPYSTAQCIGNGSTQTGTSYSIGGDRNYGWESVTSVPTPLDFGDACMDLPQISADRETKNPFYVLGNPGTGKSSMLVRNWLEVLRPDGSDDLRNEIQQWQGGRQTNSAAYEKLCTRTLMRLFADDLTLWNEQAKSNSDLYRFDLICKVKRDNHKDFWEMAERYFSSKYIIFEFKNYAGKVTQKEVYTTVRYLYPTALRRVAIIISPNGIDDHADKAIRGVLRDEGKLILSLTNRELVHMLQMKEDGEDPADYLSDKLDELLIDLEK